EAAGEVSPTARADKLLAHAGPQASEGLKPTRQRAPKLPRAERRWLYDNVSRRPSGSGDGPASVRVQRLGLPRVDRPVLPQRDRVEAPRVLARVRHRGDQLDVLPVAVPGDGPRMGALHPGRLRVRGESP